MHDTVTGNPYLWAAFAWLLIGTIIVQWAYNIGTTKELLAKTSVKVIVIVLWPALLAVAIFNMSRKR